MNKIHLSRRQLLCGLFGFTVSAGLGSFVLETPAYSNGDKILIAYFSHSGNTRKLAEYIQKNTGGKLVEIRPAKAYSQDYDTLLKEAKKEKQDNARPDILVDLTDLADYNPIFIGYPNWWGTMPMPICTFLEKYNLAGKTLIPFCTHGGSRFGDSERDLEKLCPKSKIVKGFEVYGTQVDRAAHNVDKWLAELGFARKQ